MGITGVICEHQIGVRYTSDKWPRSGYLEASCRRGHGYAGGVMVMQLVASQYGGGDTLNQIKGRGTLVQRSHVQLAEEGVPASQVLRCGLGLWEGQSLIRVKVRVRVWVRVGVSVRVRVRVRV